MRPQIATTIASKDNRSARRELIIMPPQTSPILRVSHRVGALPNLSPESLTCSHIVIAQGVVNGGEACVTASRARAVTDAQRGCKPSGK